MFVKVDNTGTGPMSQQENHRIPIYFCIGKFNPPHRGHELMLNRAQTMADKAGASLVIAVVDTKKLDKQHPLEFNQRIIMMSHGIVSKMVECSSLYQFLTDAKDHYNILGWVQGEDRDYLKDVNRIYGPGQYDVLTINRQDVQMSSTIMRSFVENNNWDDFIKYTIGGDAIANFKIFNEMRQKYYDDGSGPKISNHEGKTSIST